MAVLRAGLNPKPCDPEEVRPLESAEHGRGAEPLLEKGEGLRAFIFEGAAERVGVARQPFQTNLAKKRRIGRGKPAQFDPG
jgi:predicted type IV restriction endonuclease